MRYLTFTAEAQTIIDHAFDLAEELWGDCDFDKVRVLAGNYAGYGKYVAHYKMKSHIIEIPLNDSFSPVRIADAGIDARDPDRLLGVMLHELGHHVEKHHPAQPWKHLKAKSSTHSSPSWCWVTATGWHHFFPKMEITPELLAFGIRQVKETATALSHFEPNQNPQKLVALILGVKGLSMRHCVHCNELFEAKRSDAKFCSTKCRVYANRNTPNTMSVYP